MKTLLTLAPTVILALLAPAAFAQPMVGQVEFQAVVNLFSCPFGLAIGLIVTTWGLWTLVVSQKFGRGFILIILGVVVSIFPNVYNAFRTDLYAIPTQLGGSGNANDFSPYLNNN